MNTESTASQSLQFMEFLGSRIELPMEFSTPLPFSDEDKKELPWLRERIRRYGSRDKLGGGGRAETHYGYVADQNGNPFPGFEQYELVIKIPNISQRLYTTAQISDYLFRQQEECGKEWQLTRDRLRGCPYANPIFDLQVFQIPYLQRILPVPVTIQLFLRDALPLDKYLLETRQRSQPYQSRRGEPCDNWHGMSDPARWTALAAALARGLADIHERRVVHGDIWPPNVFIRTDKAGTITPVFIDFGEAFPMEPHGEVKYQRDHVYRAPERRNAEYIVTKRADVYSYGKLLLHLATGEEPILSSGHKGHERRADIKSRFLQRNPLLAKENPFIVDIVCNCLALDSVDRPSMNEVLKALTTYVDTVNYPPPSVEVTKSVQTLADIWNSLANNGHKDGGAVHPFFSEIVSQRIVELGRMIGNLSKDSVSLKDTREYLILALVGLFLRLKKGDRFISVTSPRMWQGSALGLNGRYFSATQLAASRGASIQRAFVVSVQELGLAWSINLGEQLCRTKVGLATIKLGERLLGEARTFKAACEEGKARELPESVLLESRERFRLVIKSYVDASKELCDGLLHLGGDTFSSFEETKGVFVGILPVGTLSEMRKIKAAHPISVFQFENVPPADRYLLMMTECLGRSSLDSDDSTIPSDDEFQRSKPELRGVMFFKSVRGVPEERIMTLEHQLRQSIGIGTWAESLLKTINECNASR